MPYQARSSGRVPRSRGRRSGLVLVVLFSLAAWSLVAVTVAAVAEGKPRAKAKAAAADGTVLLDDPITVYSGGTHPDDPCASGMNLGQIQTVNLGLCYVNADIQGSIRWRLGKVAAGADALLGLPDVGANRGPLDFINDQTKGANLKLATVVDDLAAVETLAGQTRDATELTAARLETTNARLSSLGDQLADLEAATSAVAEAIDAQGPNLGSPTFPGTSDENPSVVRLASSEFDASELVERSEQSVMFAAGLLAALFVGAMLWRSALGASS